MAKSKYEYVRHFEQHATLLRNTYVVVRVDGHGFHRFCDSHAFAKPNDPRALALANAAAIGLMGDMHDIVLAYGQSDEFSFLLRRDSTLFKRREAKIVSTIASLFTAHYITNWPRFMVSPAKTTTPESNDAPSTTVDTLHYPPSFDARAVCYPSETNVRDYFAWRQVDCHINNLYNTAFWALVHDKNSPCSPKQAESILKDTTSSSKNELLFTKYGINYNNLPEIYRKGSVLFRRRQRVPVRKTAAEESNSADTTIVREQSTVCVSHEDIIGDAFWAESGNGEHVLS